MTIGEMIEKLSKYNPNWELKSVPEVWVKVPDIPINVFDDTSKREVPDEEKI